LNICTRPLGKPRTRWKDIVRREASHILEYENGGDEKTEKNGGAFLDGVQRPEVAVRPQMGGFKVKVKVKVKVSRPKLSRNF